MGFDDKDDKDRDKQDLIKKIGDYNCPQYFDYCYELNNKNIEELKKILNTLVIIKKKLDEDNEKKKLDGGPKTPT